MVVGAVSVNNLNNQVRFGNTNVNSTNVTPINVEQTKDSFEPQKNEASTAKKVGVGFASACITGLGQLINGQVGKAAAFFGSALATGLLGALLRKSSKSLGGLCFLSSFGIGIWSIVDAVQNAKPSKN